MYKDLAKIKFLMMFPCRTRFHIEMHLRGSKDTICASLKSLENILAKKKIIK